MQRNQSKAIKDQISKNLVTVEKKPVTESERKVEASLVSHFSFAFNRAY